MENASENVSENAVWGAVDAPKRGEASRETVRSWKRRCEMLEDLGQFGRRAADMALNVFTTIFAALPILLKFSKP